MRAVLRLPSNELEVLCLAARREYLVMLELLHYTNNHARRFHHPREARLFASPAERSPAARPHIQSLLDEHLRLATMTRTLTEYVHDSLADAAINTRRLASCAWDYIALQRQHMAFEEKVIFPQLERTFCSQDWAQFECTLPSPDALSIGGTAGERYLQMSPPPSAAGSTPPLHRG